MAFFIGVRRDRYRIRVRDGRGAKAGFRQACLPLPERFCACRRKTRESPAASTTNNKGHPSGWPFLLVFDVTGIESASGTDAGRRQGFGKHASRCLSGFAHAGAKPGRFPPPPPPITKVILQDGLFYWCST